MKKVIVLILAAFLVFFAASCGAELPPDDGTPAPAPLDGVYSGDGGTMTFNGDGRSVVCDLTEDLAAKTGLPAGHTEGTYVFLFAHGEWRRDKAETFRLTVDGESFEVPNEPGYSGDSFAITADREPVVFYKNGGK